MAKIFFRALVAMTFVSTAAAVGARADEATILLCRIKVPPPGPVPAPPVQMEVGGCQTSAGANLVCPIEGTSCAEALAAVLSRPGFKLKGQVSTGFDGTVYTFVNPRTVQ